MGWKPSKIYHIGTQNIPCEYTPQNTQEWSRQYLAHCDEVLATPSPAKNRPQHEVEQHICLPDPDELSDDSLANALLQRKTCRSFTGAAMTLNNVSTLLYLTLGYLRERDTDRDDSIAEDLCARRSSPSGGGLNACEGFLLVQNVDDLSPGIYAYHRTNPISRVTLPHRRWASCSVASISSTTCRWDCSSRRGLIGFGGSMGTPALIAWRSLRPVTCHKPFNWLPRHWA